jgi:AcrR family transcriptional regulator
MKRIIQKEQTRDLLLATAYSEFADKGFMAVKTVDIAHAAGLSHGTLFLHFPTREELLIKVIDEFGLKIGAKLQQLTQQNGSPKDILKTHLSIIKQYEPFYTRLVSEGPLLPAAVRCRMILIQSGIARHLEKKLTKKKQSMPIHFIVNSWLGLIHYYLANRDLFAPKKSVIAECGDELLNHFVKLYF